LDGRLQDHNHTQVDDWGVSITNFIFSIPPAIWIQVMLLKMRGGRQA
jgi:hypothetical protein